MARCGEEQCSGSDVRSDCLGLIEPEGVGEPNDELLSASRFYVDMNANRLSGHGFKSSACWSPGSLSANRIDSASSVRNHVWIGFVKAVTISCLWTR
jgi:hypothetical protein